MLDEQDLLYSGENKIAIFAGAGVSQESGIPTFRDIGGIWIENNMDIVCNIATAHYYQKEIFDFYNKMKKEYSRVEPNEAHYAVADLQNFYGAKRVTVYTSNMDMLLEEAGCSNVVHVHGDCEHSYCWNCCKSYFIGDDDFNSAPCPYCDGGLKYVKPGVIFFGESAPKYQDLYEDFSRVFYEDEKTGRLERKHKLIIGTSFNVISENAFCLDGNSATLVDLNPNSKAPNYFSKIIKGKASENAAVFKEYILSQVNK